MSYYITTLLLGGNEGNVAQNISKAIDLLQHAFGSLVTQSAVYQSPAWGFEHPQAFLNQVVGMRTSLLPDEQLSVCQAIENQLGRVRDNCLQGYQARTMDIDILFIDSLQISTESLVVPHPLIAQRRFVLQPLKEILPDFVHPVLKLSIAQLLAECNDNSEIIRCVPTE